jgi:hypothetical protein
MILRVKEQDSASINSWCEILVCHRHDSIYRLRHTYIIYFLLIQRWTVVLWPWVRWTLSPWPPPTRVPFRDRYNKSAGVIILLLLYSARIWPRSRPSLTERLVKDLAIWFENVRDAFCTTKSFSWPTFLREIYTRAGWKIIVLHVIV